MGAERIRNESARPVRFRVYDPDETDLLPAQLYLACRPDEDSDGLILETRELSGQLVVLGYSTLDTFLAGCGADQPWILLPANRIRDFACVREGSALESPEFRFGVLLDGSIPSTCVEPRVVGPTLRRTGTRPSLRT